MKYWRSGSLLALANIYGVIANFIAVSMIFNSVNLRIYGFISLLLATITIFQTIFNTQSWQGILNGDDSPNAHMLRKCLAFDVAISIFGSVLLFSSHALLSKYIIPDFALPAVFLIIILNVALTPPGVLISIIRRGAFFGRQAIVDITSSTVKIFVAAFFINGIESPIAIVIALVLPEVLRWFGYFLISIPTLLKSEKYAAAIEKNSFRAIYGFSFWGLLTEVIHLPAAQIDKLLIGAYLGLESLAIWDIVKRCVTAVVPATAVVNQILFPYFVKNRAILSTKEIVSQCLRHCYIATIFIGSFYLVASITVPIWFPLAFHNSSKIRSIEDIQLIFSLLAFVMTLVLGGAPIHALFLSLRHSSLNFRISLFGNILFLVLSFILLPSLQMVGASFSLLASGLSIILIKYYIVRPSKKLQASG